MRYAIAVSETHISVSGGSEVRSEDCVYAASACGVLDA